MGYHNRQVLKNSLSATLAKSWHDKDLFDSCFDRFFSFDDVSIEATRGLKLEMVKPEKHANNPVVARGKPGEPDSHRV